MKKLLLLFSLIGITAIAYAQNDKKILALAVPHYKVLRPDSTYTTDATLNRNKPVMFIYFMPDCSHCQHLMSELKPDMDKLKNIQIVMVSAQRTENLYFGVLKNFFRDYDLAKYKNVTIGTEYPKYDVYHYFNVEGTPFIAIYDKHGKMTQYFTKPTPAAEIIAAVKKAELL